ncbi:MAG TPA: hypothetical protein V6D47_02580 [Oscillatoriaceae cyanobacterium]
MRSSARKGSVLATSITMVALFLMIMMGTMAYFDSAKRQSLGDRWRDTSEQAARSGLDFVLDWGNANIDEMTRLPADWEMVTDNEIRDPMDGLMNDPAGANLKVATSPSAATVGQLLKGNDGYQEYVLAKFPMSGGAAILVTFRARVQQYKISDNMPRQYRVGSLGRVRYVAPSGVTIGKSATPTKLTAANEEQGVLAERMVMAEIGKAAFSRYAALIDIDAVKNWVPGEVVYGPVHINRGYVDDSNTNNNYKYSNWQLSDGADTNAAHDDMRSIMDIRTAGGGLFNPVTVGGTTYNYPIFMSEVSMTGINDGNTGTTQNDDDIAAATNFIQVDDKPYKSGNISAATAQNMFRAPENQGVLNGMNGPLILNYSVNMPRSTRSGLTALLGVRPGNTIGDYAKWFSCLEDGVYLPGDSWWTQPGASPVVGAAGQPQDYQYDPSSANTIGSISGGIYIRGNVEIMRMTVEGKYSYYFFQLGPGDGATNYPMKRRCYAVRVDRVANTVQMRAWQEGKTFNNGSGGGLLPNNTNPNSIFLAGAVQDTDVADYALYNNGAANTLASHNNGNIYTPLLAPAAGAAYPFNGVIFVDLSAHDPARDPNDPTALLANQTPLTGNIYALGDPGLKTNRNNKAKFLGTGSNYPSAELVATNQSANPTAQAASSKLTIFVAGNIFIQNDLLLAAAAGSPGQAANVSQDNFSMQQSLDLLGLVADKQIAVGACAPTASRGTAGCIVHAAIAALGDPGYDYSNNKVPASDLTGIRAYRGSFTTEGLMQVFATPEDENYTLLNPYDQYPGAPAVGNLKPFASYTSGNSIEYLTPGLGQPFSTTGVFPTTPLSCLYLSTTPSNPNTAANPNVAGSRGTLLVFGSVTEKKRGIVGIGNRSYDKDFQYDKRLLSLAPPLFPTSTNIITKISQTFGPHNDGRFTGLMEPAPN